VRGEANGANEWKLSSIIGSPGGSSQSGVDEDTDQSQFQSPMDFYGSTRRKAMKIIPGTTKLSWRERYPRLKNQ